MSYELTPNSEVLRRQDEVSSGKLSAGSVLNGATSTELTDLSEKILRSSEREATIEQPATFKEFGLPCRPRQQGVESSNALCSTIPSSDLAGLHVEDHRRQTPVAQGQVVFLDPATISFHPELERFLPHYRNLSDGIAEDMKERGFDQAHPICLAIGPWSEGSVVWDGHTRLRLASEQGIGSVPCVITEFDSIDEVIDRMIYAQAHRRPLDDSVLLEIVDKHDKRKTPGKKKSGSNEPNFRSAEALGKLCCKSESTIKRVRKVIQHDDSGMLRKQVKEGTISLHQALKAVEVILQVEKGHRSNGGGVNKDRQKRESRVASVGDDRDSGVVGDHCGVPSAEHHEEGTPRFDERRLSVHVDKEGWALTIVGYDMLPDPNKKDLVERVQAVVDEIEHEAFGR
ncbi:MAG: hypothetical protein AB1646_11710 [Thermodesulfobacteriota bacterium]